MNATFYDDYKTVMSGITDEATKTGSPYDLTKQFIQAELDNFNITEKEKAELTTNLMIQVTVGITQAAMRTALAVLTQGEKIDEEVNILTANKEYKQSQKSALDTSVTDNQKIKFLEHTGDLIGVIGSGGLTPPGKLFENFFTTSNDLLGETFSTTSTDYPVVKAT